MEENNIKKENTDILYFDSNDFDEPTIVAGIIIDGKRYMTGKTYSDEESKQLALKETTRTLRAKQKNLQYEKDHEIV